MISLSLLSNDCAIPICSHNFARIFAGLRVVVVVVVVRGVVVVAVVSGGVAEVFVVLLVVVGDTVVVVVVVGWASAAHVEFLTTEV